VHSATRSEDFPYNRFIEKQEYLIYEDHGKYVEVEKSLALEKMKNDLLAAKLSSCHSSISRLKNGNDDVSKKLDECHVTSSSLSHVSICNRYNNFDIDACVDHTSTIVKLNDEIARLRAGFNLKLAKNEVERLNLLGMPLVSMGDPRTQRAIRPPTSLRRRGRCIWLVVHILHMIERTMLIYMLMLRMFLIMLIMFIMMLVLIVCYACYAL
jgi:hypothetical protein